MPTSPNLTQTALSDSIKTRYERRLLVRAIPRLIHSRFGEKASISQFGSLEWRRYSGLAAISSALTEGQTPTEQSAPTLTLVTATPLFYGAWIGMSDELEMTTMDPLVLEVSGILGEQAGLSVDTLVRNTLTDGATKLYSGVGNSARTTLDASQDNIAFDDILVVLGTLWAGNAREFADGRYKLLLHPHTYVTLMSDPTFVSLFEKADPAGDSNPLRSGFMGTLLMCDIYMSSNAREYADGGVGATDVYSAVFIGREAYGVTGIGNTTPQEVDMAGPEGRTMTGTPGTAVSPVDIIVKQLGSAGAADPLNQRSTIGWKASVDTDVLNSAFVVDLEHTNSFSDS